MIMIIIIIIIKIIIILESAFRHQRYPPSGVQSTYKRNICTYWLPIITPASPSPTDRRVLCTWISGSLSVVEAKWLNVYRLCTEKSGYDCCSGCVFCQFWGRYHVVRRPSSDDSFHSPTVIPPWTPDKPSIMKRYHRRPTSDSTFADDGNASWYSVCRVSMVEWRLDCENCRHLTIIGLHDTGPWCQWQVVWW